MAWIQFTVTDGNIHAVTSEKVSDLELAMKGRAQIEVLEETDVTQLKVDTSVYPPTVVSR